MSKREELQKSNEAYKNSLEKQLDKFKGDVNDIGKTALWIGGGLFATYLVVDALTASDKKKKSKGKSKKSVEVPVEKPAKDNLLMSTVKEQALIFVLGLAAQQLAKFLSELDSEDSENAEEDS